MNPKVLLIAAATALMALVGGGSAHAANAYTTASVNMRAGPGGNYPVVSTVPRGSAVTIHGCTEGYTWCDTSWSRQRGWISARYLNWADYGGRVVYLPDYADEIDVPIVDFYFDDYWYDYYRFRPWYRDRWRWHHHRPPHHGRPGRPGRPDRPDRPGRPDRPDRPDRPGRPDWPDRPGRPDRPDRPDRPGRPDWRPDRPDRPSRPGVNIPRGGETRVVPRAPRPQIDAPRPRIDSPRPRIDAPRPRIDSPRPQVSSPRMSAPPAMRGGGGGGGGGDWRRAP
ncbi:SH3 domain-containing protein [Rhodoligotrophos ferricapiens]|uniref:SH3 domain-containing protein n=1 Tax=Rhodoligotrophos ferricapiens TaxID=3069264 RepID=UPI00315CA1B1